MKRTGKNNLAQENERLQKENARLIAENKSLRQEVKLLNEKMDWLMKKMFGSSSEALNSNQLDLFAVLSEMQAPEADASLLAEAMIPAKSKTKSPRRERIPENLPAEEVVIDPPEVMADPEKWRRIGEEISDGKVGKDEGRSQKGGVDAVSVVAFAYDSYTNPSKNNGVLRATLTKVGL